jgi:hypothetical protein
MNHGCDQSGPYSLINALRMVRVDTWEAWVASLPTQFRAPFISTLCSPCWKLQQNYTDGVLRYYAAHQERRGITSGSVSIALMGIM